MTKKLTSCVAIGVVVAAVVALSACSTHKEPVTAASEVVHDVALVEVQRVAVPDTVEAVGTVRASESAQLAAQIMGNVVAVNAHEGDRVRRGQVLVVIDDAQPRAAMERTEAALSAANHEAAAADADFTLASATMKRYQDLFDKKAVSPQEFDEVKARVEAATARRDMSRSGQAQAKAALAQARTMFDYSRIHAPFDGLVTDRRVDPGAMATPGMPLLTVESGGRFRLEAIVTESDLRYVRIGEPTAVQIDALGDGQLKGIVVKIVPAADAASRSFTVKVELAADPQLRSGLFGRAYFTRGQRESLIVPRTAVVNRGQLQGVYVAGADQIASLRYVTLGKVHSDMVEVLSGLRPGDQLVTSPGARDLSGKKIQQEQR